jgi:hypothetical protein
MIPNALKTSFNDEGGIHLINGTGAMGTHLYKEKLGPKSTSYTRKNYNWIKDVNVKDKNHKNIGRELGQNPLYLGVEKPLLKIQKSSKKNLTNLTSLKTHTSACLPLLPQNNIKQNQKANHKLETNICNSYYRQGTNIPRYIKTPRNQIEKDLIPATPEVRVGRPHS